MPSSANQPTQVPASDRAAPAPIDRKSLNLPNLITLSRLLLAFVLFALISLGDRWQVEGWWIGAAGLFAFAAATDAVDGYVARRYGQVTTLGRILDPFVDKIIVCGAFVFLLERGAESGVTGWMVIAVIGREMFVTGLRSFLEQNGRDFSAVWSGKIKMALQCAAVTASLLSLSPIMQSDALAITRDVLLWSAVAITVYSGLSYAWRGFLMLRPRD